MGHSDTHTNLKEDTWQPDFYEQFLAAIPLIIIAVDSEYRIRHWNKSAQRNFGIEPETILGKPFLGCGIKWDWSCIAALVSDFGREQTSAVTDDIRYEKPNGQLGYLRIHLNKLCCADVDDGILVLAEDITDRKMLEYQLGQAQRLRSMGALAGGIATELNLPAQAVCHNLRFLESCFSRVDGILDICQQAEQMPAPGDSRPLPEKIKAHSNAEDIRFIRHQISQSLQASVAGIEQVIEVTQEMRDFSMPLSMENEQVDINRMIEALVLVSRNYWKSVAQINTELDMKLPRVNCNRDSLKQILLHVLVNATEALVQKYGIGTNKGLITIRTFRRDSNWILIEIGDTGPGIPQELQSRIFEPFFTTRELGKHAGQGLTVCRALMDKIGGMISFETDPGAGTTFTLHIRAVGIGDDNG